MSQMSDLADLYTRTIFGEKALRRPATVVLQYQGEQHGTSVMLAVAIVEGETRLPETMARGFCHECLHGEIIFRPARRYADDQYHGCGIAAFATSGHLAPSQWRWMANEAGVLVPNPAYDPDEWRRP